MNRTPRALWPDPIWAIPTWQNYRALSNDELLDTILSKFQGWRSYKISPPSPSIPFKLCRRLTGKRRTSQTKKKKEMPEMPEKKGWKATARAVDRIAIWTSQPWNSDEGSAYSVPPQIRRTAQLCRKFANANEINNLLKFLLKKHYFRTLHATVEGRPLLISSPQKEVYAR